MTQSHVVVLHTPAGGGHRAAADAISASLSVHADPDVRVTVRNVLDLAPRWFRYDRAWSMLQARGAGVWDWLFDLTDHPRSAAIDRVRLPLHRALFRALDDYLIAVQPTHVVATHYLPAIAVGRLRQRGALRAHATTVVTDHLTHRAWVTPGIDTYCVADHAVARALRRRAPGADVRVTGIPIAPAAASPARAVAPNPAPARALVLLGGVPEADALHTIHALAPIAPAVRLRVLCGASPRVMRAAAAALAGSGAVIEARAPSLLPLLDEADVVVTKAGGLSVSECLARGRAMVLPFRAPGQERGNLFYALDAGAAVRPHELADTGRRLLELCEQPNRLRRMGGRARLAARPNAAADVARVVVSCATSPSVQVRRAA